MPLVLAISDALKATLGLGIVFGVAFPALVTILIGYAISQSLGERRENEESRTGRFRDALERRRGHDS